MRILSERTRSATLGAVGLCLSLSGGKAAAQEGSDVPLSLWTSNAPIGSVLEQVVGSDVFDVRIGDGVEGLVSGRLEGSVREVLEPLLDRYELSVHNDGSTVWFDRRDREVSELVELDSELEPALAEWAARELDEDAPGRKGQVSREGPGLRVSGSRAFVQSTLGRLSAARDVLSEASSRTAAASIPEDDAAPGRDTAPLAAEEEAPAVAAMSVWREPPETLAMPDAESPDEEPALARTGPPFRSVTDIPGFQTEYR